MRVMGWILVCGAVAGAVLFFLRDTPPVEPDSPLPATPESTSSKREDMQARVVLSSPATDHVAEESAADASIGSASSDADPGPEGQSTGTSHEQLIRKLRSANKDEVFQAAVELANLGASQAIAPLSRILREHKDYYARLGAATALGSSGSADAVAVLIDALGDRDDLVRISASEALQQITKHKLSLSMGHTPTRRAEVQRKWREWWRANESHVRARSRDRR